MPAPRPRSEGTELAREVARRLGRGTWARILGFGVGVQGLGF